MTTQRAPGTRSGNDYWAPSPEEIRKACAAIRANWSGMELERRRVSASYDFEANETAADTLDDYDLEPCDLRELEVELIEIESTARVSDLTQVARRMKRKVTSAWALRVRA